MIVVDASAALSILLKEPDEALYIAKVAAASIIWMSPVNWWEVQTRIRSEFGPAGTAKADAWMQAVSLSIEPITWEQTQIAITARARYAGAPARLNLGDCFAYALARNKGVPLLYKGGDFGHTDIESAELG